VVLNLINYIRTSDNIVIPGCFLFDSETDFTARVRIVMRIEYRGSKVPNSTGLTRLAEMQRHSELTRPKIERKEIIIRDKITETTKEEDEKEVEDIGDCASRLSRSESVIPYENI
jgi:hypothetical protein